MKKGDKVFVNEINGRGEILKHEWQGVILSINGIQETVKIKDVSSDYKGQVFFRFLKNIEKV